MRKRDTWMFLLAFLASCSRQREGTNDDVAKPHVQRALSPRAPTCNAKLSVADWPMTGDAPNNVEETLAWVDGHVVALDFVTDRTDELGRAEPNAEGKLVARTYDEKAR